MTITDFIHQQGALVRQLQTDHGLSESGAISVIELGLGYALHEREIENDGLNELLAEWLNSEGAANDSTDSSAS